MECKDRLRLIRAMHALSQQELADLAGTGRSFIGAIEEGRKQLPEPLAELLANKLHVDYEWLFDERWPQPLQGAHLLIIDFPPRKVLVAARNLRPVKLNDSIAAIERLWPLFLGQNPAQRCWLAEAADDQKLLMVIFNNNQGILFRLSGMDRLAKSLIEPVRVERDQIEIDREQFEGVTGDLAQVRRFFQRCGIGESLQDLFMVAAENILPAQASQMDELKSRTRKAVLLKICAEMSENDIGTDEIEALLRECDRSDLIKSTSH